MLPMLWAMKNAPVIDAEERGVLMALAESAWSDGTDAFPSKKTIAHIAVVDPKTVQRRLRTLAARGLIAEGNQKAAAYIPSWCRPKVYDLLIPYSWYPDIEQVNAERRGRGKPPLTRENRPDLAPAPPKKTRADKGKPRKTRSPQAKGRGLQVPPVDNEDGGTTSPQGGDYKSLTRGLQDPQPSPTNPPQDTPRPSVPPADTSRTEDGGTDGESASELSPGVELLLSIGARKPEFLLTGRTLSDQGLMVTGMLLEGWTPGQLEQVIAGRPLPQPVRKTVGAIVSGRLRDANVSPAPSAVPFPDQEGRTATGTSYGTRGWVDQRAVDAYREGNECDGRDGLCGRPRRPGSTLCWECSSVFGAAAFTELHDAAS
ncbi:helix-turn-helix domain-containing protein [Streptomyces microflavus]|uniref:helix-turn-helix domain-containing protein n=1 Tax=Streptomyces microflavus TaxID=1919 RepID=UPI002256A77A|nr:helix-turn-helix domain-containing protein [Streptomyces microflavus]MCX4657315.1 helix-turn-helix domain-containing protein [Streptomyces microflavus]